MADDDPDKDHSMPFALPIGAIQEQIAREHDRAHMAHDELVASIDGFFDSLTVEQLVAFRRIMCMDPKAPWMQYFDGMAYMCLRLAHKVNPDTGESLDEQLAPRALDHQ